MTKHVRLTGISHAAFERSVLRSSHRDRALRMISSLGEAFPRQLAHALGIDSARLHAIMHGAPPKYSESFALVTLGLVEERATPHGRVYAVTTAGRRKARQLAAREIRRERVRRMRAEERGIEPVYPHRQAETSAGVPAPAPAPPDTQSFRWSLEA